MTELVDLGPKLNELADQMLDDANQEGVPLDQRLEVFKIVSQHYVSMRKVGAKHGDDDNTGTSMETLRARVNGSGQREEETNEQT